MRQVSRRWRGQPHLLVTVLIAAFVAGGCSTLRIHRPADLANAISAQKQFREAALADTVVAERKRLDEVLAAELELVRAHTLARRDARLLFFISEAGTKKAKAWKFLTEDIESRVNALIPAGTFDAYLQNQAKMSTWLENLEKQASRWKVEQAKNPNLPALQCPLKAVLDPAAEPSVSAKIFYKAYASACSEYLSVGGSTKPENQERIEAMQAARDEVTKLVQEKSTAYRAAKAKYSEPGDPQEKKAQKSKVEKAFQDLADFADKFETFETKLDDGTILRPLTEPLEKARTKLEPLLLDGVVSNLKGAALLAKLKAQSEDLMAQTQGVVSSLGSLGRAVSADETPLPLAELLIQVEQVRLEQEAAKKDFAFYDQVAALLAEQQEAVRLELTQLGEAERLRRELESPAEITISGGEPQSCLDVLEFAKLFEQSPMVRQRCQERFFRLLVAYSNAWELGRVKQEQIRYRMVGLHHQSALDTSELAFAKWQNLIGVPIDRLVAYHETGLKVEDVMSLINALGLGAIAVGVN